MPDLLSTAGDPLRRIAWLHGAVIAIGVSAIAWLLATGFAEQPALLPIGSALLAALALVALLLITTRRIAQRERDERRHAEQVLRETESVFRQLAGNVREVFYLCEWPSGGLIFVSPAFAREWGWPVGDAFRLKTANPATFRRQWIDDVDARDRERIRALWEREAARGGFDVEYRITRGDGEERWIHDRAFPVLDADGRVMRIAGIAEDVTAARQAQRELARRRDALESANQDLARSNAELEQFASVASHDLQEPLRKLVSFSDLLRVDLGGDLTGRAAQDLEFITDAARRMRTLVMDLLTLSRTGTSEMKVRAVSLDRCVDRVLEALDLRVTETRAVITRDPLPHVMGDPTLLEELYQNLLSNALKFVPPGVAPRIHLSAEPGTADTVIAGVRDEGIGIEPDRVHEIFRPFRRLHSNDKYPGTGIGLAIARKAVDRHGGRLWVETEKGCGCHFHFSLTRVPGAADE
jgi:PAS domain S-box-containing protein